MTHDVRSRRQMESLRRIREWHLDSALRAQLEGRDEAFRFHMQYYQLLGPAVAERGNGKQRGGGFFTEGRLTTLSGTAAPDCHQRESS